MNISVIIPAWKRFRCFDEILKAWLAEDRVDEIIVWDNSGEFKTSLPGVIVLSVNRNLNSRWVYLCAQFCKNDLVLHANDDFIPEKGITDDLYAHCSTDKVVGIMGKKFVGETYYTSQAIDSKGIKEPSEVSYLCSNMMLAHRENFLNIDYRAMPTSMMDDWWWEHEIAQDGVTFWVVPTRKWEMIAEGEYEWAHHRNPKMKEIREYYFQKWVKGGDPELPPALHKDQIAVDY